MNATAKEKSGGPKGYVDYVVKNVVRGWAFDPRDPAARLKVEVVHGGTCIATLTADAYREGLKRAGKGDGRHEFRFDVPDGLDPAKIVFRLAGDTRPLGRVRSQGAALRLENSRRHPFVRGAPKIDLTVSEASITPADVALAGRLAEAFLRAVDPDVAAANRAAGRYTAMWEAIERERHPEVVALLRARDAEGLARHLNTMHMQETVFGVSQGRRVWEAIQRNPQTAQGLALGYWDKFVSLAEALGALPVEDPEKTGHWGRNIYLPYADVEAGIAKAVGLDVTPPLVASGLYGLRSRGAPWDTRTIEAVYSGWRLNQLLPTPDDCVCEIGAGLGWSIYYAVRMGARNCRITDLPVMNVLQGWCLAKSLPGADIALTGETFSGNGGPRIAIGTPESLLDGDTGPIALYFNQNSMPEIGKGPTHDYLARMKKDRGALFLSINQECEGRSGQGELQLVVHREVAAAGGFRPLSRHLHWLRQGYLEELFRVL